MRREFRTGLWGDERGAAIIFAAVSVMVLAAFVALAFNLGRAAERRIQVQLAADSAAYSGAVVQANALSTIAWINDGMAQIYNNLARYAVDVCATGVAAELEYRLSGARGGPADSAYGQAYADAQTWLPRGKQWLLDLSRIEGAVALVTPRLMQETMYDVATSNGAEYVSLFPSARLFPHPGAEQHFRIEQFFNGWRITDLGDSDMLWVYRDRNQGINEWHIVYSRSGLTQEEVVIYEVEPGVRWVIRRYDSGGGMIHEVTIINDPDLGWIVAGRDPSNPSDPGVRLQFQRVDMDGDGTLEGTRITVPNGNWQVFKREAGHIYLWNRATRTYDDLTIEQTTIGGIPVRVNVTNVIQYPGITIHVGQPVHVDIGRAHITLTDPPHIDTGIGPVHIGIRGFDATNFRISCNGFLLNVGSADGRWRKYYDPGEDLWWRHRLTEEVPLDPMAERQWQYDYELLGAHLRYEANRLRYVAENGLYLRTGGADPPWAVWFDLTTGAPRNASYRADTQAFSATPDPATGLYLPTSDPPQNAYYRTHVCTHCGGSGYVPDPNDPSRRVVCGTQAPNALGCHARDHDRDGRSDIRVAIGDLAASTVLGDRQARLTENDFLDARVYQRNTYGVAAAPALPLVLTDEFFKYGVNVAAWRAPESAPMIFNREPAWGYVAVASARIGVPTGNPFAPRYIYQFDVPGSFDMQGRDERERWVEEAPENLYRSELEPRLVSSRRQVDEYDLKHLGSALAPTDEGPVSYLWSALMLSRYSQFDEPSTWLDSYQGRTNRDVPNLLNNMRDRRGRRFDINSRDLEDLIYH